MKMFRCYRSLNRIASGLHHYRATCKTQANPVSNELMPKSKNEQLCNQCDNNESTGVEFSTPACQIIDDSKKDIFLRTEINYIILVSSSIFILICCFL